MLHNNSSKICTWRQFAKHVRSHGCELLKELDKFPNAVLVTGCQRSGTTMVARLILKSEGMVDYWVGKDDELDAALILSGKKKHTPMKGRYCFQTTYLNECYQEYFRYRGKYRLIWVLRNPFSVIYSMLHNWSRFALNELFDACGASLLTGQDRTRYEKYGRLAISRVHRACMAYQGKTSQLYELHKSLGDDVMVIDYDDLVSGNINILESVYQFIGLTYKDEYVKIIHKGSLGKAKKMSPRIKSMVEELCMPTYFRARSL